MLKVILQRDNGIASRHLGLPDVEHVFSPTADELNETFRVEAHQLAARALAAAQLQAGLFAGQLDALLVCICPGYLCPG
jgi:predicted naringenin-chalcone synthase